MRRRPPAVTDVGQLQRNGRVTSGHLRGRVRSRFGLVGEDGPLSRASPGSIRTGPSSRTRHLVTQEPSSRARWSRRPQLRRGRRSSGQHRSDSARKDSSFAGIKDSSCRRTFFESATHEATLTADTLFQGFELSLTMLVMSPEFFSSRVAPDENGSQVSVAFAGASGCAFGRFRGRAVSRGSPALPRAALSLASRQVR